MQYSILRATSIDELVEKVSEKIAEGWKPLGGVSASLAMGATMFCQAMTK